jgi:hypothetical protein
VLSSAQYVAVIIPFFSAEYLPDESGLAEDLIDYRLWQATTTGHRNRPRWWCVRLSHNGLHFRQLCDPTTEPIDGFGDMTGVVRRAVEEMFDELRRGHFVDARTRLVTLTLQLKSNHVGVRYRLKLVLEFTSLGAVLPSFDVETRLLNYQRTLPPAHQEGR